MKSEWKIRRTILDFEELVNYCRDDLYIEDNEFLLMIKSF